MKDEPDDDPLMGGIRRGAARIRSITGNTDTYPEDAWSKRQLMAMLAEIQDHAIEILRSTGIADVEAFYARIVEEELLQDQFMPRDYKLNGDYQPYSDLE